MFVYFNRWQFYYTIDYYITLSWSTRWTRKNSRRVRFVSTVYFFFYKRDLYQVLPNGFRHKMSVFNENNVVYNETITIILCTNSHRRLHRNNSPAVRRNVDWVLTRRRRSSVFTLSWDIAVVFRRCRALPSTLITSSSLRCKIIIEYEQFWRARINKKKTISARFSSTLTEYPLLHLVILFYIDSDHATIIGQYRSREILTDRKESYFWTPIIVKTDAPINSVIHYIIRNTE